MSVTPAINANQLATVTPSVLAAGGNASDLTGLILTNSTRSPIGTVQSFPNDGKSVAAYFGAASQEAALSTIYFNGFDNSNKKPASILFAQYNTAPVPAYLRGGNVSGISLTALQAINGTLSITIDGVLKTGTINLSAATSLSNAAQIIGDTLNIPALPEIAVVTGSITTTVLTVTAVQSGTLAVGALITGGTIAAGTFISSLGTGTGGTGTYNVNTSQSVTSTTVTATLPAAIVTASQATTVLTVTAVLAGTLAVGQIISGTNVVAGTYIVSLGTGTGGTGTYNVSVSASVASTTVTAEAPGVSFDSTSGGFVFTSATVGAASTISAGSGATAATLLLTIATGAVLSQGAAANTPGTAAPVAFMPNILAITTNWAGFTTTWEPSDLDKQSFSTWGNSTNGQFFYSMWETNVLDVSNGGPAPAPAFINAGNVSGTVMIYQDPAIDATGQDAAFVLGYAASLDFTQTNGRATLAGRGQTGLQPTVYSTASYANAKGYGVNVYGAFTTANQQFNELQPGKISGPFLWVDSYVNQIWMNRQFQLDLLVLMQQVKSIPYNPDGYALIEASLGDTIKAAVNFGAIRANVTLSSLQVAEVNAAAGVTIDKIINQRGWYLQVKDASPTVRQARGSPPCTFWYMDGQSIQQINLASVEGQ